MADFGRETRPSHVAMILLVLLIALFILLFFDKKKFIKSESKELWKLTEDLVKESVEKGLYL